MEAPRLGHYRHYKGGEYESVAIGKIESNLEDVVIYRDHAGNWWVRPLSNFCEQVRLSDGKVVSRFTFLD